MILCGFLRTNIVTVIRIRLMRGIVTVRFVCVTIAMCHWHSAISAAFRASPTASIVCTAARTAAARSTVRPVLVVVHMVPLLLVAAVVVAATVAGLSLSRRRCR